MKPSRLLIPLLVLACIALNSVMAQEVRATLSGRVTDPTGAVVPGATVTAISEDTNVVFEAKSNNQGIFTIQFLLPAHYNVAVSAEGFKKTERMGVELQTADVKQLDVQLEIGNASQTVEVTSDAPCSTPPPRSPAPSSLPRKSWRCPLPPTWFRSSP